MLLCIVVWYYINQKIAYLYVLPWLHHQYIIDNYELCFKNCILLFGLRLIRLDYYLVVLQEIFHCMEVFTCFFYNYIVCYVTQSPLEKKYKKGVNLTNCWLVCNSIRTCMDNAGHRNNARHLVCFHFTIIIQPNLKPNNKIQFLKHNS